MPLGEVIMRVSCPSCCESVLVRSEPPCTSTTRSPCAANRATSCTICSVATPLPPPIFTTSILATPFLAIRVMCGGQRAGASPAPYPDGRRVGCGACPRPLPTIPPLTFASHEYQQNTMRGADLGRSARLFRPNHAYSSAPARHFRQRPSSGCPGRQSPRRAAVQDQAQSPHRSSYCPPGSWVRDSDTHRYAL